MFYIDNFNGCFFHKQTRGKKLPNTQKQPLVQCAHGPDSEVIKVVLADWAKTVCILIHQCACPVVCAGGTPDVWGIQSPVQTHVFTLIKQRILQKLQ